MNAHATIFNTIRAGAILRGLGIFLVLWSFAVAGEAQEPTAEITTISGAVFMSIQGTGDVEAAEGTLLKAGDIVQTQEGAGATLTLSDGSVISVGENTKLDITELTQTAPKARKSRFKVLWGRIRMRLSPGHQSEGSSMTVDTLNAQIGVKFSQPDVEIGYDASANITIVKTYTVAINVRNLLTGAEVTSLPVKHQAIVKEDVIIVSKITDVSALLNRIGELPPDEEEQEEQAEEEANIATLLETQQVATGSLSAVPVSAGSRIPGTSETPGLGDRTERPERRTEPVGVIFTFTTE